MRVAINEARLAFVVLSWNSENYIEACLKSVLEIECLESDIFLVDNGSTDRTVEIVQNLMRIDSRIHMIALDENLGTTVSRNMALRKINDTTDYICILDSDTEVNNDAFQCMTQYLAEDRKSEIGLIGPTMRNSKGEAQLSGRNLPTVGIKLRKASLSKKMRERGSLMEVPDSPVTLGLQDVGYLLSACWLMPSEIIAEVGLLDEAIFYAPEDVDYCIRIHQRGLRVVYCPAAVIMHDYQRISHKKMFSKTNVKHVAGLIYYFNKWKYLFRAPR